MAVFVVLRVKLEAHMVVTSEQMRAFNSGFRKLLRVKLREARAGHFIARWCCTSRTGFPYFVHDGDSETIRLTHGLVETDSGCVCVFYSYSVPDVDDRFRLGGDLCDLHGRLFGTMGD